MNKKIKVILMAVLFFLVVIIFPKTCEAVDLDEIVNYTTTVSPRDDGTLDIKYHIEWKVLDSTLEGPLEWVQIGIPNQHVDSIKKISDTISSVKYMSNGGNYVKVKFKKKYYAGETVTFDFSIHQSHMYTIDNSTGNVSYEFTPGWFDDIRVDEAIIKWEAKDVLRHSGKSVGNYITWSRTLEKGQKITAKVVYSVGRFNLNYNKQADNVVKNNINNTNIFILIMFIIVIVVYVISMAFAIASPTYYRHGGYGYYGGYYPYYHHHHHYHGGFGGGFGGGLGGGSFGGGRRRWRFFMCMCLCMCWRRTCRLCKERFLWNKFEN